MRCDHAAMHGLLLLCFRHLTTCAGDSVAIQAVLHWQYLSISRGGRSLLERLSAVFSEEAISRCIGFYALRRHGALDGATVTEQIYVHSKLMIVDDDVVVMGSANINDRSMRGSRDSEVRCACASVSCSGCGWRNDRFRMPTRRLRCGYRVVTKS